MLQETKYGYEKENFECGESAKLCPRRTGPWVIVEVKENGRNFLIKN